MQNAPTGEVLEGQAVYSKFNLKVYDAVVLGISNEYIWRCPTSRLLAHYNAHVTGNHMDIGVGTGFFLDKCRLPASPRVVLVDLNENSLAATAKRIARYQPRTYRRNVLEPLDLPEDQFESAGLNYLLHCVPGSLAEKAATAFKNINAFVKPGGTVFGSTLLHAGAPRTAPARALMAVYNRRGIFHNTEDTLAGLKSALDAHYASNGIEIVGSAALFWGRVGKH